MINGEKILRERYSELNENQYQPAGIDLRLGRVFELDETKLRGIFDGTKLNSELKEIKPGLQSSLDGKSFNGWLFEPNKPYIVEVENKIEISKDSAQFYLPRSTLLRNGVTIETALGDPGYKGHLRFLLVNHRGNGYFLEKGERFAQLIDIQVKDSITEYDGDYQED